MFDGNKRNNQLGGKVMPLGLGDETILWTNTLITIGKKNRQRTYQITKVF